MKRHDLSIGALAGPKETRDAYKDRAARLDDRKMGRVRRDLADRIVAERTKLGLTQEGAASAAGIDVRLWQHLEAASARNPTLLTLMDVAAVLDLSLSQLLKPVTRVKKKS